MRVLLNVLIVISIVSCSRGNKESNNKFRNVLMAELELDADTRDSETMFYLNQTKKRADHFTSEQTENSLSVIEQNADSMKLLLEMYCHSKNPEGLSSLINLILSTVTNKKLGKQNYNITLNPIDLRNVDPRDTSFVMKIMRTNHYFKRSFQDSRLKNLYLKKAIDLSIMKSLGRYNYYGFNFHRYERKLLYQQKVWMKGERAFIIPAITEYDLVNSDFLVIKRKVQNKNPIRFKSNKSGLNILKGKIGFKKRGEVEWEPFEIRILIE
jgi:hypothetical protein